MTTTEIVQRQERYGTASEWATANTVLLMGEIGYESDTGKGKIGDGATPWNSILTYSILPDSIPASLVNAKGDLIVASAADTVGRLAVDAIAGRSLVSDPAEALGMKWALIKMGLTPIDEQSFTGAAAVNFTNKMSAAYRNYKVIFYSNDSGSTRIRLRSGSTDDTSANYDGAGRQSGSGVADHNDLAQTSWRGLDQANTQMNFLVFDLLAPALATPTGLVVSAYQAAPGTNQYSYAGRGLHRAASAFDGVSIILGGAGTFTGKAALYGYEGA